MAGEGVNVGSIFGRLGYRYDPSGSQQFETARRKHEQETRQPINQELGFKVDEKALSDYHRELDKVRAKTQRRDEFKAKLGGDFDSRAFRQFEREAAKAQREAERLERQTDRLAVSGHSLGDQFGHGSAGVQHFAQALRGLFDHSAKITAVGVAIQGLSAAGAGLTALASGLAPAAGALAAYPALASAAAQGLGVFKLATDNVFKAVGGLNQQLDKSSKAYKSLTPQAKVLAQELERLKAPLRGLSSEAQKGLFPGLEAGIKDAERNLPVFRGIVRETAGALGDLARRAGEMVGSKAWGRDLATQGERNTTTIRRAGTVALNLADAMRHVVLAAGPLVDWMTRWAVKLSDTIDQQARAGRESGKLAGFFHQTEIVISRLVRIGGDLGHVLFDIGKAAYPLGNNLLRSLTLNADAFRRFMDSARGENALRRFFADARPAIYELGKLLRDVVVDFARLGQGQQVAPLLRIIRTELLPAVVTLVDGTTKSFGPPFIDAVTQALILFTKIGGSSGPLVGFTKLLDQALRLVNRITDSVPGIGTAISALAATGGIAGALGLRSALGRVRGLSGALGRLTAGAGGGQAGAPSTVSRVLGVFAGRGETPAKPLFVWVVNGGAGVPGGGLPGTIARDAEKADSAGLGARLLAGLPGLGQVALAIGAFSAGVTTLLHRFGFGNGNPRQQSLTPGQRAGVRDTLRQQGQLNSINPQRVQELNRDLLALQQGLAKVGPESGKTAGQIRRELDRLAREGGASLAGVDDAVKGAAKRFDQLKDSTHVSLKAIRDVVRANSEDIAASLGKNSAAGKQALAKNFRLAAQAVQDEMAQSGRFTKAGLAQIKTYLADALRLDYGFTLRQARHIAANDPKTSFIGGPEEGTRGPGHAGGGFIGARGMVGGDTVPAMLGVGEAVLNRHQQAVIEGLLGHGFLDRLFSRVTTPHYLASGGRVPAPTVTGGGTVGSVINAAFKLDAGAASRLLSLAGAGAGSVGSAGAPVGGGAAGSAQLRRWLTTALRITGYFSPANLAALTGRALQESGGDPTAINLWDSNAKAGHPSKGLLQTIDGTFNAYKLPGHGNIWNPVDNAIAAIRYMIARYHHIVGRTGSGYARGGRVLGALQRFAKGGRVLNSGRGALTGSAIFTGVDQAQGVFARLQAQIATKQKTYDVAERRYNEFAPDVLNPDGTLNQEGISERAAELDGLIGIRNEILTLWLRAQAIARQAVTGYSFFIRRLQASLGHARGKDRSGIRKQLAGYRQALADWKQKLSDTGFDVQNAQLDVADTQKEKADVLGTTPQTSSSSGGASLTPDQQALLDQATALKQVVTSGNFIDTTAQRVLATFSPQTGFQPGPPSVASVVAGAAAAPGPVSSAGVVVNINQSNLHPGDPKVWTSLARTAVAGIDLGLTRRNVRTAVGV